MPLTKNGDARQVPLSRRAVELLGLLKGFDKPFAVDKDVLSSLFRRVCLNAKIENTHFHDAALTRLSKKLNVLELARMVVGHRDIRNLQIYYRETAQELALKFD